MFRRKRFAELVARQLDLFESDARTLLDDAVEADSAWTNAGRETSEELYGDYQLVVDEIGERLLETRETYAETLDGQTADDYRGTFNRAARKRFGRDATTLLEET